MKNLINTYKNYWSNKTLIISTIVGVIFFALSLLINHAATSYATNRASSPVQDIVLSNIPVFNVDYIVTDGALLFLIFIAWVSFAKPNRVPFVLKSAGLFVIIRSIAITLTHIGLAPERSYVDPSAIFGPINLGADLFFSGHTGLPFLMALVFWKQKFIRNISFVVSLIFAVSVLLGHLHYSIDVFAAFFITYSIFHLSERLFAKDRALFKSVKN